MICRSFLKIGGSYECITRREGPLASWIQTEVVLKATSKNGARGQAVRRVQEWLNLQGFGLVVDDDFGNVTKKKCNNFRKIVG